MQSRSVTGISLGVLLTMPACSVHAHQPPEARSLVQRAVDAELAAGRADRSHWHYKAAEKLEDNSIYEVIETSQGAIKQKTEQAGQPVTPAQRDAEAAKVRAFVNQITETHVHIDGRALLFKTIGQQTDEVKTGLQPVPPHTTLAEAAAMLNPR